MCVCMWGDAQSLALFESAIVPRLPGPAAGVPAHRAALGAALARTQARQASLIATAIQIVAARCSEPLGAVRSIITQYRMTDRDVRLSAYASVRVCVCPCVCPCVFVSAVSCYGASVSALVKIGNV
jgi:NADH:ubiquinone oxidoreductase subunit E